LLAAPQLGVEQAGFFQDFYDQSEGDQNENFNNAMDHLRKAR
jgi:hypothetical protein